MKKNTPASETLSHSISILETKRREAADEFKRGVDEIKTILTPRNLVRNIVEDILDDPQKRNKVIIGGASAVGMILLKKFLKKKLSFAKKEKA